VCEAYFGRRIFERINAEREEAGEPRFANPRNAASGTIRQLDPAITARRRLEMFAYDVFAGQRKAFATHWDALNWARCSGISGQRESRVVRNQSREVIAFCNRMEAKRDRSRLRD
jgi:DNA ligase (NAD+)